MRFPMAWRADPGPCPVDDAPHTTCCAPDPADSAVAGSGVLTIPAPRTAAMDRALARAAAAASEPLPTVTFTTKTYRRALHGPNRKR